MEQKRHMGSGNAHLGSEVMGLKRKPRAVWDRWVCLPLAQCILASQSPYRTRKGRMLGGRL